MARSKAADDKQLLAGIRVGEVESLGELFDEYGDRCLRFARRVVGEEKAAQDAVVDAFLTLWRQPPRRSRSLKKYLVRQIRRFAR